MCKKGLLFYRISLCLFGFLSVCFSSNANARPDSVKITIPGNTELCEEALLILADTLRFHPMFDDDFYWGDAGDTDAYPSIYLLPLTFEGKVSPADFRVKKAEKKKLPFGMDPEADLQWLYDEIRLDSLRESALAKIMAQNPFLIVYDRNYLPDAPKTETIDQVQVKDLIKVEGPTIAAEGFQVGLPKADKWVSKMTSAVQFSQNYVSDNWYQGGESNINILSYQSLNIKYFDDRNKVEFETLVDLKAGFYTTPSDTVRAFRVNENLFQVNSKLGIKAFQKWYYTAALQFKTQVFNNYKANSNELLAQVLSPGEVNLSVGMDYKYENPKKTVQWSILLAPASYNLKFVANIKEIDETRFGIEEGDHALNQIGSSLTNQLAWKITDNIKWESRLYFFSNYEHSQGDFENNFNFTINRYFSTRISFHLRYDNDTDNSDVFQFKELLSFGFNYVW